MRFADLHCHNHMRAYFHVQRNRRKFEKEDMYTPWTVISSNQRNQSRAGMAAAYSQTDLVKCWNGKVSLTFNSLYPIEKGFFRSPEQPSSGNNRFLRHIIRVATHHNLPIRDVLQAVFMRIPDAAIQYFQSSQYDYWKALNEEMDFMMCGDGIVTRNKIHTPGFLRQLFESEKNRRAKFSEALDATGLYHIPKNSQQLTASLHSEAITMVMTIEGAHALGTDNANLETLENRVDYIKTQWPFPVFFITFAHHFDNLLCGHAHSIPDMGKWLLNQDERKNEGFSNNGWVILRKFLSLNVNNERDPDKGYRILIDVKHMSAKSRKEFYEKIIHPCFDKGDVIPVIASHCGYSGRNTLQEHIDLQDEEKDGYFDDRYGQFNAWNINICDEDIKVIHKTKGMFGLSFDQRIVGLTKKDSGPFSRNNILVLWENISAILRVIYEAPDIPESSKPEIWNRVMIGTDFEGLIDPVDPFPTVLELADFRQRLIDIVLYDQVMANPVYLAHLTDTDAVTRAVDDICFRNAEAFVKRHYPV